MVEPSQPTRRSRRLRHVPNDIAAGFPTLPKRRAAWLADVVDCRLFRTSLHLTFPTRQQQKRSTQQKERAAWAVTSSTCRLFQTSTQQTSKHHRRSEPLGPQKSTTVDCSGRAYRSRPRRDDDRHSDIAARTSPVAHRCRRPPNKQRAPSQCTSSTVDCPRRGYSTRPLTRRRSDVPTHHNELPTVPSAAKWHNVHEAIVRRASPMLANGVGCRLSQTKLQQAFMTRRHPTVSDVAARTRPTARRRRAEHGSAWNSKFSSSAVPNSRRRAHVDATAAMLPAASPKSPMAAFTKAARLDALSLFTVESLSVECPLKSRSCPSGRPRRDHRR